MFTYLQNYFPSALLCLNAGNSLTLCLPISKIDFCLVRQPQILQLFQCLECLRTFKLTRYRFSSYDILTLLFFLQHIFSFHSQVCIRTFGRGFCIIKLEERNLSKHLKLEKYIYTYEKG